MTMTTVGSSQTRENSGTPVNLPQALEWFRFAAVRGHTQAIAALQELEELQAATTVESSSLEG